MNIFERIKQDHDRQRDLAARLLETTGDSPERRQLWGELHDDVEHHAAAEEQTFYAALIEKPDGQKKARHSISEHEDAAELLGELDDMDMSSPGWLLKFRKLKEELEHHMDEEESEVFGLARKLLSDGQAEELGAKFGQRKAAAE